MLNKQKGQMYGFIDMTWNPIKGKCPHECSYCYMTKMYKRYKWDEKLRLDEKCLQTHLGKGNFIFVGSSTDMWANNVKQDWIIEVLETCKDFELNKYLFQSKNPMRFQDLYIPEENMILATTIETNYMDLIKMYSDAPDINSRIFGMQGLKQKKMVTIEPIMDFNLGLMFEIINHIEPFQVNIGADSGHNNLPEPPKEKIEELITELRKFTTVHLKDNLRRIYVE